MHTTFSTDQLDPLDPLNSPQPQPAANFWLAAQTTMQLKQRALPIRPVSRQEHLPLSFNQERLWLLEQLQPDRSVYNLLHTFRLKGCLNLAALEQSLVELVRRHEILRTCFPSRAGEPVQSIAPDGSLSLSVIDSVIDLQSLPSAEQAAAVQTIALDDANHPFDLSCAPLWRFKLLRLAADDHVLIRTIHHLVFDGMSHSVFLRELGTLYAAFAVGELSPLSALPIQYADFAYTQRQWFQEGIFSTQLDYWRQTLSHHPVALILPIDRPRPAVPGYQGNCQSLMLSEELTDALKALSVQQGVSLFVTLLAAFQMLLYGYSQQEDMLICSPVASRHYAGTRALIGYFNNLVVTRTDLSGNPSFAEVLTRVSQVSIAASANQEIPLQQLSELPGLTRTPLTRAMFVFQNTPNPTLEVEGLTISAQCIDRAIADFELALSLQEQGKMLIGALQYRTELFDASTIEQMLENFQMVLHCLVANPDQTLTDLPRFAEIHPYWLEAGTALTPSTPFVAPRNETEAKLSQVWQAVLGVSSVSVQDSFFDLGGHSLLAVQLFSQIEQVFSKKLPLSVLIEAPTIAQLATRLGSSEVGSVYSSVVLLKSGISTPALFLIHDGDGETLLYRNLAQRLDPTLPVYGVQPYSRAGHPILHTRITEMADYYIKQIQAIQPQGPYLLGGLCAGGVLAFEIARHLQRQGQTVAMVAIMDAADVAAEENTNHLVKQFMTRLSEFLEQSQKLKPYQRPFYLFNQMAKKATNWLIYKVKTWMEQTRSQTQLQLFRYFLDRHLPLPSFLHHIPVRTTFLFAEKEYAPDSLFQGEIVFLRATESSSLFEGTEIDDQPYCLIYKDPLLGWGERVTDGVRVYDMPGGHSSMLQEPNVQVMAETLNAYIKAALDGASGQQATVASVV